MTRRGHRKRSDRSRTRGKGKGRGKVHLLVGGFSSTACLLLAKDLAVGATTTSRESATCARCLVKHDEDAAEREAEDGGRTLPGSNDEDSYECGGCGTPYCKSCYMSMCKCLDSSMRCRSVVGGKCEPKPKPKFKTALESLSNAISFLDPDAKAPAKTIMGGLQLHYDPSILLCPWCGSSWLHHKSVDVFERREDSDHAVVTRVSGSRAAVTEFSEEIGHSPRRSSLRIRFWCESCPDESWLIISQHKGQTFVAWGDVEDMDRLVP